MRIISGNLKGRRLNPPTDITARPTTDFAKEGLFNTLGNLVDFEGLDVLDLFAGTGSIGLEFASRGARSVVCIEAARVQADFIRRTCTDLRVSNLRLMRGDVFRYLRSASAAFDLIFADPPYAMPELPELPDLVFSRQLLRPDGLFVLEHPGNFDFSGHPRFSQHRTYGKVNFTFFA